MLDFQIDPVEKNKPRAVKPVIQVERCKGCGICAKFCPEKILVLGHELNSYGYPTITMIDEKACTHCLRCSLVCPDVVFAFVLEESEPCWKH
jgi:2-oxoglutarate ferredoxin oxidoreductase subunit delta